MKNLRIQNRSGLIISYLNVNSIRNKIESLRILISDNVDILIIAETKIDRTFPSSQFYINGFKEPFRFDRDKNGGGLLIYVREGVPAKLKTDFKLPSNIECGIIEINLNKKKWLLLGIYRPPSQQEEYFLNEIGKALDDYSTTNENFILVGDFNTEEDGQNIRNFLDAYGQLYSFSNWRETNLGVPQGSVLGPLLFNICINDMLCLMEEAKICNHADDTTIYVVSDKIDDVVRRL